MNRPGTIVCLAENASLDTAERFLAHPEASFDDLAEQPMMGAPLALKRPDLHGLRKCRVRTADRGRSRLSGRSSMK